MQAVRVSWTVTAGASSERVTSGSDGRYMSIASGVVAVRPPRRKVTRGPVRCGARAGDGAEAEAEVGVDRWSCRGVGAAAWSGMCPSVFPDIVL
ncbi:hypothetical protein SCANM63S_07403 [Streptomyces canarius]